MEKYSSKIREIRRLFEAEKSSLQKEYQEYFKSKLEKYGVKSPSELDEEKKKQFFDEIAKEWEKGVGLKK